MPPADLPEPTTEHPQPVPAGTASVLLALAIAMIAFNLRPALTSPGPLLSQIMAAYGIETTLAGALTMVPLFCLGLFGAAAAWLARRLGPERVILAMLIVLAAGIAVRGAGPFVSLIVGTTLAGLGIGIVQVLLPAIVKRDFPGRTGVMTGIYTMMLCLGAAAGAAFAVPLQAVLGSWQSSLGAWALPAFVAALAWLPQALSHQSPPPPPVRPGRLWRDPLAWQVTAFMGLQSCFAYITIALLPLILEEGGMAPVRAGYISAASIATQIVSALVVPSIAARLADQRGVVAASVGLSVAGYLGLLYAPHGLAPAFAVVNGLGLGAALGSALILIVLRAPDSHVATELSGMAQSVGYVIAAFGPFGAGLLREASGGWTAPTLFFLAICALAMAAGWGAGRRRLVLTPS
ncbi:CP family cyanate transporter-like MFS transporter [Tepidamorphus gemmatus]|jgi:CP family cyanate transporter-like MFS transporter|uniref:CP family cyanate transporter-like MFS transporter n=1 Tax=Tepidamorphus gemmatus TaxID=747076 RepID=A0A4R3MH96_9HYPH|nr:MFS transporter [Tepidamorphus gemmatus]TCT11757.1 CP family cyanate transporter-like MFS transporter [Tepidamorphus gemmatus]